MHTYTGIRVLRIQAFDRYEYGRTVGTEQAFIRAFKESFTVMHTVWSIGLKTFIMHIIVQW